MTAVFFVMCFDVAPIVIWILELPLDQEIRAVRVIRILLGFERGLVVVAIAEGRSGYVVGVKVHGSPSTTQTIPNAALALVRAHSRLRKCYKNTVATFTPAPSLVRPHRSRPLFRRRGIDLVAILTNPYDN